MDRKEFHCYCGLLQDGTIEWAIYDNSILYDNRFLWKDRWDMYINGNNCLLSSKYNSWEQLETLVKRFEKVPIRKKNKRWFIKRR